MEDPDLSRPLPGVSELLRHLASRYGLVAVVSGRPVSFLVDVLAYPGGDGPHPGLFGVYGLERWTLRDGATVDRRAEGRRPDVDRAAQEAAAQLPAGVLVEHKGVGVTLHWRSSPDHEARVREVGARVAASLELGIREGKMCVELVPDLAVDKGTVVAELLGGGVGVPRDAPLPPGAPLRAACFLGDDLGDLAAFLALDAWAESSAAPPVDGGAGAAARLAVKIAVGGTEAPPALLAAADAVLGSPQTAVDLLVDLAR